LVLWIAVDKMNGDMLDDYDLDGLPTQLKYGNIADGSRDVAQPGSAPEWGLGVGG
jgi:hypothetical protein